MQWYPSLYSSHCVHAELRMPALAELRSDSDGSRMCVCSFGFYTAKMTGMKFISVFKLLLVRLLPDFSAIQLDLRLNEVILKWMVMSARFQFICRTLERLLSCLFVGFYTVIVTGIDIGLRSLFACFLICLLSWTERSFIVMNCNDNCLLAF